IDSALASLHGANLAAASNVPLGGFLATGMLKFASLGATGLGLFLTMWSLVSDQSGPAWRYYARYCSALERRLRLQFIWTKGSQIFLGQIGALFLLALLEVGIGIPYWGAFLLGIIFLPIMYIENMRKKRVALIEFQLDNFILGLANALKSTPSIGGALATVAAILSDPTRQEVDLCLKEMKVGSTLDQALIHMASRISSRAVDTALSAVLIGRQVGGNLPKVLEQTANSLREMGRLEGVLRTKTAEGKMQLYVLGGLPLCLFFGLNHLFPGYFIPMSQTISGQIILFVAGLMWITALVLARKILSVDL
ncbi:MAG: type II secretion system F family protein, partial [Polyangiaceae bacterium]